MVHDLHAGAFKNAQLAKIIFGHDAQRGQIDLGALKHRQVLGEPQLLQQLLNSALQAASASFTTAATRAGRDRPTTAPAANPNAPDAARSATVCREP